MKAIFATIFLAGTCLGFMGCESDLPPDESVGKRFERGVIGEGEILQPDRSEDPLINESSRVGY